MKETIGYLRAALLGSFLAGAVFISQHAVAAGIVYNFDNVFSGDSPNGSAPWFQVYLEDITPGTVRLHIDASNLSPTEKVTELYLNLNPNWLSTSLSFSFVEGSTGVTAPMPSLGLNAFKADGDGKYDILFQFAQTPSHSFTAGEHLTYDITGISGMTATDFVYLSMPAGGHGPFYSAIHMQGIGSTSVTDTGTLSGWVSPNDATVVPVPEPTAAAFALAFVGLAGGRAWLRRRSAK